MTQVAARYGYSDASVARVVDQAGVSRATFYEHFAGKEACFLAAFERAAQGIELALARVDADVAPARRAPQLLDDLLASVVSGPAAARLLLVEAFAGGAEVRLAHERLARSVETTLERWLRQADEDGLHLAITGRALMEGLAGILARRSFRGETARVADLRDDLLAWIDSHLMPPGHPRRTPAGWRRLGAGLVGAPRAQPRPAASPRRLPRGRGAVAPEAVAGEYRERILEAVKQLTRTKGYVAMTVADIVSTAAVTREAFYELFRSKEDAFLAAQVAGLESSISVAAAGFFAGETWETRVWDGLEALFGYSALEPDFVYLDVLEGYAAGSAAIRRSFDNRIAYHLFLEDGYRQNPTAERLPRLSSEAVGGAILGLMRCQVSEGRTERMLEALPQSVYLALAPFIGPVAAIELVEAKAVAEDGASTA
ncbi:MAG TPA: TetR/AcrR family transcriptional regulator [Solirubrobacterales bacterium]|nr:TetR/AcrR family transcriptional regulator [Solirubrobacterales bacterium]